MNYELKIIAVGLIVNLKFKMQNYGWLFSCKSKIDSSNFYKTF